MSDNTKPNTLPDLPGLESVEARSTDTLLIMTIALIAALTPVVTGIWAELDYHTVLRSTNRSVLAATLVMTAAAAYAVYQVLTTGYRWSTDADGITERGLLRRRRILWKDVLRAESRLNGSLSPTHCIQSAARAIKFGGIQDREYVFPALAASCWQHLRRVGKADRFLLRTVELSLWDSIPGEALESVEVKERAASDRTIRLFTLALLTGMAFMWSSDYRQFWPWIGIASLVSLAIMVRNIAKNPIECHYVIDSQGLRILGKGSHFIAWNTVTNIRGSAPRTITVTTNEGKALLVGPQGNKEKAQRAILAWIRHKRDLGMAVPIPDHLRLVQSLVGSPAERLDLRMPSYARYCYASGPGLLALLAIIAPPFRGGYNRDDIIAGCAVLLATALVYLACSVYHVTADEREIVRTCILGTKRVQWSDVVKYERNIMPKPNSPRRIKLKDAHGNVLISLGQDFVPDWYQLVAYVDIRLAHLLPRPEEQPAYLSRPFNFEVNE